MRKLLILFFLSPILTYLNISASINTIILNVEIRDTSIKEIIVAYTTDLGLTSTEKHINKDANNKASYIFDCIHTPTIMSLTIGNDYYSIWGEPNSDLNVTYDSGKVIFSGKGKIFADYYLDSKAFWQSKYNYFENRNPVLSGKPEGYKYFKVQDSITIERQKFLDSYFEGKVSLSFTHFIKYEKQNLLYTDIFFKISGLTNLKDFKFYQEHLNISLDSFLTFTDKFDFNNTELFEIFQYRRCLDWLCYKYIKDYRLDPYKDIDRAIDFVISLSKNELCQKNIEIIILNVLIENAINDQNYESISIIKQRLDKLGQNTTTLEKYINIVNQSYSKLVESEKKSHFYISLLDNPQNTTGIALIDVSKEPEFDLLRSIVKKHPNKVLYIDFWAPWCGPCMEEMPNSKKLYEKYVNENIVFIYLAVNCTDKSWKSTIAGKEIKGDHYLLNDQQSKELESKFQFSGIPRYIIINKEGIVINSDAPRPSEANKLEGIFNEILK
jgi:thiol-disulfide isomerase/thioredoxin